jgi:phosphoglycerol transferase MdoB-like AlkP superfamily enzyme
MLKYFLRLALTITLLGLLFRLFFLYYFREDLQRLLYAWIWGIRFDIAMGVFFAALATFSCATVFVFTKKKVRRDKISQGTACLFVFLTLLTLIGDTQFFLDSGRHVTYEAKSFFISFFELTKTGFKTPPWLLIIFTFLFPFIIWKGMPRLNLNPSKLRGLGEVFLILLIGAIGFRGGPTGVPQNPSFSYKLGDPKKSIVAMNGAYGFYHGLMSSRTIPRQSITLPPGVDSAQIVKDYLQNTARSPRPPIKANVVFILLEGWPARILKSYGSAQDTAPFFDSLRKKSLSTAITFAGGLRTTEGIFSIFCAWPNPLGRSIAKSQLEAKPYHCLPRILHENGWSTSFFQGTTKETSGTGELAQAVGFENSFGKYDLPDYKDLPKSDWGIFDRDIYKFVIKKAGEMKEPFIVGINSNSTHSTDMPPYDKPTFGCTDFPSCFMSVFASADRDLEKFFNDYNAVKRELPTIWVLVADHTSKDEQRSRIDGFRVPMLIYSPEFITPEMIEQNKEGASAQRDVGITLAHLLGMDTSAMLGRSLLDKNSVQRSEYFHQGILGWQIDARVYEISISEGRTVGCYDWRTDTAQKNNLLASDPECIKNSAQAEKEALAIMDWSQEKLFSGTIGK